jgi:hypothetical protein
MNLQRSQSNWRGSCSHERIETKLINEPTYLAALSLREAIPEAEVPA